LETERKLSRKKGDRRGVIISQLKKGKKLAPASVKALKTSECGRAALRWGEEQAITKQKTYPSITRVLSSGRAAKKEKWGTGTRGNKMGQKCEGERSQGKKICPDMRNTSGTQNQQLPSIPGNQDRKETCSPVNDSSRATGWRIQCSKGKVSEASTRRYMENRNTKEMARSKGARTPTQEKEKSRDGKQILEERSPKMFGSRWTDKGTDNKKGHAKGQGTPA